jgi:TetR/AcrR family transcriptional repressor of nem operon
MDHSTTHPTRQALLDHALHMLRENGLRNLTVRSLCLRAGENTGSFVYHFGSRDQFATELIENWYAPLFQKLQWQLDQQHDALTRLQDMLRQLLGFLRTNSDLITQLLLDAAAGEKAVLSFMSTLSPRHPQLMLQCVQEAQHEGHLCEAPAMHQLLFLMSALGLPVLVQQLVSGRDILPAIMQTSLHSFATEPAYIEQRLQWAIRGLRPVKESI